jgi:hypothetical protein
LLKVDITEKKKNNIKEKKMKKIVRDEVFVLPGEIDHIMNNFSRY